MIQAERLGHSFTHSPLPPHPAPATPSWPLPAHSPACLPGCLPPSHTGAILGNFFLSYFSQAGHGNGPDYAQWVLDQAVLLWETFADSFLQLWNDEPQHKGELYKR